ncbi:N-acetylmuramoyl-L-alanine amidase family protein [Shimazuella soli]|uniref:peptidoglycan recognition protein family protein n=1 Tax=Shimazuella soli TaxID=1892854 RepID=UPI0023AAC519|nr:N-acetylmuramoyl-L-alanine amidase [Shimazuella soli]
MERGNSRTASWHFTCDDHQIIQHIPENEVSWRAGDGRNGTGNRQSLSLEICVNQDGNYEKAKENAIWLIQYLMRKHNISIERVVPHKIWSGKDCPHKLLPHWNEFINKIKGSPTPAKIVDDMYDLSYLKDYKFIGLRSTKQPQEINDKIIWAMEASACVLLTKRGYDLRLLQKVLNRIYSSE